MTTPFDITTAPLDGGVTLIEASAGTGKTYSITGLILRLILEKHLQIRDILAVTFTEAATQELRDRIRRRLQSALEDLHQGVSGDDIVDAFLKSGDKAVGIRELDLAIQSFDEAQIFTIHGFCQRMLNDYAFESGTRFDTSLVTDPKPLFEEVARDFWRLRFYEAKPLLPKLAMAWKRSLEDWVELLERTRSHPDLVILPPAEAEPGDALVRRVEAAFAAVRKEWIGHQADIEMLLRHDGNLSRSEKNFREDRVDELLGKVAEACVDFESADPESIKALSDITSEAIAAGTKGTGTPPEHRFFTLNSEFHRAVEALFNQLTHEFLEFAQAELPKRKARTNTVTYDDLISGLRDALRQESGARLARAIGDKYSAALIDEFQDTDPAQYEIFRRIFGSKDHRLFLIGDPKQAIYGFRGADVFTYFQANTIADQTFTLTTNWRSEAPLLAAINRLFLQTEQPFIFPEIQYHQVHAPKKPIVRHLTNSDDAALRFRLVTPTESQSRLSRFELVCSWVSDDIAALAASGAHLGDSPLRYRDMAILVRKHSQAEMLQTVLRERGIRSVVQSDRSVFASEEARELQRFLQGVLDPRRDSLLKAALATTLIGFDAQMLFALERDDAERQAWLDRFTDWKLLWSDGCFTAMFRQLLVTRQVRARLVQLPAGERRLTNFLHLAELLHEAESTMSLAPDAVCSWLREQRESERVSEDRFQLRLESDDDAVQIVTIHKSKGLEYPIVFCPFLWTDAEFPGHKELLFHDREDREKRLTFDLRGKKAGAQQHQDWQSEEVRAEELRLLYVALTRAMNRCYIYLPEEKTDKSPLAHLFASSKKESLFDPVRAFAQSSNGCASASSEPGDRCRIQDETPSSATLQPRPVNKKISRVAMTASFSGLNVAATELEEVDSGPSRDGETDIIIEPARDPADLSIFTFDRGRRTGDFFHGVLEHMDFQDLRDLSALIEGKLRTFGFAQTLHRQAINQIFQTLMEVELDPGIRLQQVSRSERLSELEFTYPLAPLTPASLAKTIKKCTGLAADIRKRMGSLQFDPIKGFMNGFIDLLFRFKDRYYLIDWKSNWLGSRLEDYGPEGMHRTMLEHNYFLQYHLYTLAVDLFLEKRLPGYDYQTHFGGVYYIFLRGIDPQDPSRGIFRDRPDGETIRSLRGLVS
jgi:exodeoxyribonuclease V beta subunit